MENELHEASEGMRELTVGRRVRRRSRGFLTRAGSVWTGGQCQEPKASEGEAGFAGKTEPRYPKVLGVGLGRRAEGDQGFVSSAGGSLTKRKAVVRTESSDTQEYESCQLNDVEVDMFENKEESSFPSPVQVSSSAGWQEPQFMCVR